MNTPSVAVAVCVALVFSGTVLHAQATETPAQASLSQTGNPPAPDQSGSEVRIVRLSLIKGAAQLDRNTDRGFEAAFPNLPVTQGAKLRTEEGVAEVEFEDNSTLRLTPHTVVEFPQLRLAPTGATMSTVNVLKGTVYVSLANNRSNQFTVLFGNEKLTLPPSSHLQLQVANPDTRLAVLNGTANVEDASGSYTVEKKKALLFDSANHARPTLVGKLEKTPFDDWDKTAAEYHQRYANASAFGGSAPSYGISDLNYYGSFVNLAGCGSVWRPYFASAAWDPFTNGVWAWYPGAGYSWVSPYPWGWTPFHSGDWQLCSAGGWGWRPGGRWMGLRNSGMRPVSTHGPTHPRPPLPPGPGRPTLVPVNTRPLAVSNLTSSETFVFKNDSAGLGIPRQTFGKLRGASAGVAQHGSVATAVYSQPGLLRNAPGNGSAASARSGAGSPMRTASTTSRSTSGVAHASSSDAAFIGGSGAMHASSAASPSAGSSAASSSSTGAAASSHR